MTRPADYSDTGAPNGAPTAASGRSSARDRILNRAQTRLEAVQAEAEALIRAALEAEGLLAAVTDPFSSVLAYVRMSKDAGWDAHGVVRDALALARRAKEQGKAFRPDPATGLPIRVDNSISAAAGSATDDNRRPRPAYERLVAEVDTGSVTEVMVPANDRLHRNLDELQALIRLAERQADYGTPFKLTELSASTLDLNDPDGRANARMWVTMAQREVEKTRKRLKNENESRRSQGGWVSAMVPLGYRALRDDRGRKVAPYIEPDPVWGPVLAQSLRDYAAGVPLAYLAAHWEDLGVPRPRAALPWDARAVGQALRRPALAGIVTYRRPGRDRDGKRWPVEERGQGGWTALVDERTFRAAMARSGRATRQYRLTGRNPGPYTRLFRCGGTHADGSPCTGWLYRQNRAERGTHSWQCLKARGGCGGVSTAGPEAERWARENAAHYLHAQRIEADAAALTQDGDVARLAAELEGLGALLADNRRLYRARRITPDTYADTDRELRTDEAGLVAQLAAAEGRARDLSHEWITAEGELLADLESMEAPELGLALHHAYPEGIRVVPTGGRRLTAAERLSPMEGDDRE